MKAVFFCAHGGVEVLRYGDLPAPRAGDNEVVVRVRACALNHLDIWVRQGLPGLNLAWPHIPGADVAGTVESVGAGVGSRFVSGQKVLVAPGLSCGDCLHCREGNDHLCDRFDILGQRSNGGYAEFVAVAAANLLPFPDPLSYEEAASLPLVFLTAWQTLVTNGSVGPGQTVLIHAGGSGVGIAAIQIAKQRGARVITTVGTNEKSDRAKALGADETILYHQVDFLQEVLRITHHRGADLVVDHIGQETFEKSLACLAKGGRLLTCGATSGRQIQFDLRNFFGRNLTLHGSRMGRKSGLREALAHVQEGTFKPVVDSVFPLREAAAAQTRMAERKNFGKIVLVPTRAT